MSENIKLWTNSCTTNPSDGSFGHIPDDKLSLKTIVEPSQHHKTYLRFHQKKQRNSGTGRQGPFKVHSGDQKSYLGDIFVRAHPSKSIISYLTCISLTYYLCKTVPVL